ncbi:hypothetical protein LJK88_04450 [Paenibacillus sp. P26]|nr:hypothetical protein LJK88_04450 [Paenibacillus sp. P26]UUZ90676.1 hypothetical protein LJK87_33060 [Paenibacillus sp. P25]
MTEFDSDEFYSLERPIHPRLLAATNGLHHHLFERCRLERQFQTYSGVPARRHMVDISHLYPGGVALSERIAAYSVRLLRQNGLTLPLGMEQQYRQELIHYYMLRSSMCYVSVTNKSGLTESFWATKQVSVLSALRERLSPVEKKKGVDRFTSCEALTYEELATGIFKVIKVMPDVDGFHLSKVKLNVKRRNICSTVYAMTHFANSLVKLLSAHSYRLLYMENGEPVERLTTLNRDVLASRMQTSPEQAVAVYESEYKNVFNYGYLTLPDLAKQQVSFRVPIVSIYSINRL